MSSPLAWFSVGDPATFRASVESCGAVFEGCGTDSDGNVEGFAVFKDKRQLQRFSKHFQLIDYVM